VSIVVPLSAGIALPKVALPEDSQDFKIMATVQAGAVLPTAIGSSPAIGFLQSEISYANLYDDGKEFFQLHFDMQEEEHMYINNDTVVFSVILHSNVSKDEWIPVDITGIPGLVNTPELGDNVMIEGPIFDVISDPAGLFVNGQMRNNGTVLWLKAGVPIGLGELVSLRMSYTQGSLLSKATVITPGCNNASENLGRLMVGLYTSSPTVSSCSAAASNITVTFPPEKLSDTTANMSKVLLYMLRTSHTLRVNDTIRLFIPPYASIHSWPMASVTIESLAAGTFERSLFEEDLAHCNASNITAPKVICLNTTLNATNGSNGTYVTKQVLKCTNITIPPPTSPVPSSMLLLKVLTEVPAGHSVIIAIHANFSVARVDKSTKYSTNWANVTNWVRDFASIQLYTGLLGGISMHILPTGKEISLRFLPSMSIMTGEEISVNLPGFTGLDRTCFPTQSLGSVLSRASWSSMAEVLVFTVTSDLIQNTSAIARIPWFVGIRLPKQGLTGNQVDLKVSTKAVAGQVLPTRITRSPSVGLFKSQPTASFGNAQAFSVAKITVSWVLNLHVDSTSTFELQLRNFSGNGLFVPVVLGGLMGGHFNASIDATRKDVVKLIMRVVNGVSINATEPVTVVIPASAGVRLPLQGVPEQGAELTVSLYPVLSPVTIGCLTEKTGSFEGLPTISFSPPIAGFEADILIKFTPIGGMAEFEIVSVYLPGFPGRPIVGIGDLQGSSGPKFTALWTTSCPDDTITFVLGKNESIGPGEQVEIIVSSREGIRVPYNGIREFTSYITISVFSAAGLVTDFPFESPVPIGAFGPIEYFGAWVDFNPKIAGAKSGITIAVEAQMLLRVGEIITFSLDAFGGNSKQCILTTSEPPGTFGLANWTVENSSLQLVVRKQVAEQVRVTVLVPSESGITIPTSGLQTTHSYRISTNAAAGPVLPSALEEYPVVGALLSSSAKYHFVGIDHELEGLSVSFNPSMPILKGEQFSLSLPTLIGMQTQRFLSYWLLNGELFSGFDTILGSLSAVSTISTWNSVGSMVSMILPFDLNANERATVLLPNCPAWQLPRGGIPANLTSFMLSTDASAGPVFLSPVSSVNGIGIFRTVPVVTFCQHDGCNADTISVISILASFEINIGSHIIISEYNRTATRMMTLNESYNVQYELTEVVNVSVLRNFSYLENQTTFENITVEVITDDICFGPNISYGQNVTELTPFTREVLVTKVVNGTELQNITTNNTLVLFRNKTVAENYTESYNITTMYRDTIKVSLHGFNAPSFSNLVVSGLPGLYQVNASWNLATEILILSMDGVVSAHRMLNITLPRSAGFRLPSVGFQAGYAGIGMHVLTQEVNASATCAISSLGTFSGSTQLHLGFPKAGEISNLTIRFQPYMDLSELDVITILLPGFFGPELSNVASVFGSTGHKFTGFWTHLCPPSTLSFVIREGQNVTSGESVEVVISSAAGIRVPADGIRDYTNRMTISTEKANAPVLGEIVTGFAGVGFFNQTLVDFAPRKSGENVKVSISFQVYMDLVDGDEIVVKLKDFSGDVHSDCFSVWSNVNHAIPAATFSSSILRFKIVGKVKELQHVSIVVPLSAGLHLPFDWMQINNPELTISATTAAGNVLDTPFQQSPSIGYMPTRVDYLSVYDDTDHFFSSQFDMALMKTTPNPTNDATENPMSTTMPFRSMHSNASLIFTVIALRNLSKGDWLAADMSGIVSEDGEYFDVTSEPAGRYVRGMLNDNGTALWLQAGAFVMGNESVSVRMRYTHGESIINNVSIVSGCNNSTRVERVMMGIYSADPILSYGAPCNGSASTISVKFLTSKVPEKLSDQAANATYVMLYILRASTTIHTNDTIELPLPPFVHVGSGNVRRLIGEGKLESLGAGDLVREPASHLQWRCQPNETTPGSSSRKTMVVRQTIREGDAIVVKISYLFKIRPPKMLPLDVGPNVTECEVHMFNQSDCLYNNFLLSNRMIRTNTSITTRVSDSLRSCTCIPTECYTVLCNSTNYTALVQTNTIVPNCSVQNSTHIPCNLSFSCFNFSFCPVPNATVGHAPPPIPKNASIASIQLFDTDQFAVDRLLMGIELSVKIAPRMQIQKGETITVNLPGFTGPDNLCIVATSPGGDLSKVSWTSNHQELVLTASSQMLKGIFSKASISWSHGIRIPDSGLNPNQSDLTVATHASTGAVLPTTITSPLWPARAHFIEVIMNATNETNGTFYDAQMTFSPPIADQATNLSFIFSMNKPLEEFESITIYLAHFTGGNIVGAGTVFGISGHKFNAAWSFTCPAASLNLIVARGQRIAPRERVELVISSMVGIRLPLAGIRTNSTEFIVSTDASAGVVSHFVMQSPSPVGAFANVSLDFTLKMAGSPTGVMLDFQAEMDFQIGDSITLTLKGFGGSSRSCIVTASMPRAIFGLAHWTARNSTLQLDVMMAVEAGQHVTVVIPAESGIMIPSMGLYSNGDYFAIATNAMKGPVLPTPIKEYPLIGFFMSSSFSYRSLGSEYILKGIIISLTPNMDIARGESVQAFIPWINCSSITCNFSSAVATGMWEANSADETQTRKLQLVLKEAAKAGQNFVVQIPDTVAFVLDNKWPQHSLPATLSTSASAGPVLHTPVTSQIGVGAFASRPYLRFFRAQPRVPTGFELTFTPTMSLGAGSTFRLKLPNFKWYASNNTQVLFQPCNISDLNSTLSNNTNSTMVNATNFTEANSTQCSSAPATNATIEPLSKDLEYKTCNLTATPDCVPEVLLTLRVRNGLALMGMERITITLHMSDGVLLPESGILEHGVGSGILFSSVNSTHDDVACDVAAVGSFLNTSSITFSTPQAGIVSNLTVKFSTNSGLNPYDTVHITFPGFESSRNVRHFFFMGTLFWKSNLISNCTNGMLLASGENACNMSSAELQVTWISGCPSRQPALVVTVLAGAKSSIPAGAGVTLKLDRSGIQVPVAGLRAEHPFAITMDASSKSGPAVGLVKFNSIGSLSGSLQLAFMDLQAGRPTSLVLTFLVEMELEQGDEIGIQLYGFSNSTELPSCIPVVSEILGLTTIEKQYKYSPFMRAAWEFETSILKLHVEHPVHRRQVIEIVIPGSIGLRLSADGINNATDQFSVNATVRAGPMQLIDFAPTHSVGSFGISTSLVFTCPHPHNRSDPSQM